MTLKWRIALSYAALLLAVLVVTNIVVVMTFKDILRNQARGDVDAIMHNIEAAVEQANPFALEDTSSGRLQFISDSDNLALYASAHDYVQVDAPGGNVLAKSSNLGEETIPPNPAVDAAHPTAYRDVSLDGRQFYVKDRYFHEGTNSAIVHVAQSLDEINDTLRQARRSVALILGAAALAVLVFSILLAAQITTPVNQLAHAMREMGTDRLRRLQRRNRKDEIGRLAESFDDLLERLGEAFARERQFISDASHELKTPLTSINANAQMLLRWGDRDPAVLRESLETIARESAVLATMVNGMLTLAKADRGDDMPKEPVALAQMAKEAVEAAAPRAAEKHLELTFEPEATPLVLGDPALLRQLVSNLIDNAIKFTPSGRIDVRAGQQDGEAWVSVGDSGPGIPEDELPHIFDRFYRADKARSRDVAGTGLGLAIVRSIARVYGGEVTAGRSPLGGALLRAAFPRFDPSSPKSNAPPQTPPVQ